jgi:hypothetical protein
MPSLEQKVLDFRTVAAKSWKNYFQLCSCLGRPSHGRNSLPRQVLKSWIVQSLSRLGDMELQKCNISKLGMPSLQTKGVRFQTCGCQVLTIMFTCVHVLGDQIMKDIIRGKGLMLKFFAPKGFKTWEGKCGKFLNHFLRNLIFTLWGQILQCTILKLHNAHPYRFGLPNLDGCYTWYRCQVRGMSWKIVTFQNLGCQVLKNNPSCSCLGCPQSIVSKN